MDHISDLTGDNSYKRHLLSLPGSLLYLEKDYKHSPNAEKTFLSTNTARHTVVFTCSNRCAWEDSITIRGLHLSYPECWRR